MEWVMEPMSAFRSLDVIMVADDCSGSGSTLNSCSCTGGLVVCGGAGALKPPAK